MTLLDELHMELIHAADFRMYDTKGVMLPGVPYRIGVPMAAVRAAAQRIIRSGRSREFLAEALVPGKVRAHEVLKTTGLVIALEKRFPLGERLQYARQYQSFITNWALCDLFAGSMKCLRKSPDDAFCFIRELIESDELWRVRTGLVLLLTNFSTSRRFPAPSASRSTKMCSAGPERPTTFPWGSPGRSRFSMLRTRISRAGPSSKALLRAASTP